MGLPEDPGGTSGPARDQNILQALFVEKVEQSIFVNLFGRSLYSESLYGNLTASVAFATNTPWDAGKNLASYVGTDYERCLTALVTCYQVLQQVNHGLYAQEFDRILADLIQKCCGDLELRWEKGKFEKL